MGKDLKTLGRPKKPVEERKRSGISFRTTDAVREALELAAKESGRSLAQELEYRLTLSMRDEGLLTALFGDAAFLRKVQEVALIKETLEAVMYPNRRSRESHTLAGRHWKDPVFADAMRMVAGYSFGSGAEEQPVTESLSEIIERATNEGIEAKPEHWIVATRLVEHLEQRSSELAETDYPGLLLGDAAVSVYLQAEIDALQAQLTRREVIAALTKPRPPSTKNTED